MLTKLQMRLVVRHCMNQSYCSTSVSNSLLDEVNAGGDFLRLLFQFLLLLLFESLVLDKSNESRKSSWFNNMNRIQLNTITLIHYLYNTVVTFSVTGKSSSTAHTGLGTMLRSSGSSPYTSPNCQVGFKPKQLTNCKQADVKPEGKLL